MTKCNSARPRRQARRNKAETARLEAMAKHNAEQARAARDKKRVKK